jgi:glutathione S-transferase
MKVRDLVQRAIFFARDSGFCCAERGEDTRNATAFSRLALFNSREYFHPSGQRRATISRGGTIHMFGGHALDLVILLALLEYSILGLMVGRARQTYGVEAPATTGNPDFERYFRVHENTLESLIVFIPAVWIFSMTVNYHFGVALGLLFLIARIIYARGYLSAAAKRGPGAMATAAINTVLILGSLIVITIKIL